VLKFPKNFYWGTTTSAYQVEGGIKNDWSETGGKFDAGIACDHYNRFEQDFDLAKNMNNNAHRFSIEWARIEPKQGKFNQKEIEHYRKVISALRQRGLEPFVSLYHWTLPIWFVKKGGWLNKDAPKCFEKFVKKVVGEYKNLVKFWITINEPMVYARHSYFVGKWPPGIKNLIKSLKIIRRLAETHKRTYETIHKIEPNAQVGVSADIIHFGIFLIRKFFGRIWNYYFLNRIKNHQDFIGLNYYFYWKLKDRFYRFFLGKKKIRLVSDIGWEIRPKGIYYILKNLKKYNKPIYITENGLADAKDKKRAKFIIDHLKWTHKAIEEGIDVRGYFHWSLMDNFEWDKGFKPRFGLIKIDYKTLKRIPRPSSKIYAKICKNNAL